MRFHLEIPCERAHLASLLSAIDQALHAHAVTGALREDLHLIAEEVACNAIDHGDSGGERAASRHLVVGITRDDDDLHVEFRDNGRPFDPLAQEAPDLDAHILERPIGGLGVHLVRELAHSIRYRREGPYNVLHVVLRTADRSR
ncbi:ATP-binding protein [Lysobacter cavernae]|uniref:ATP-binding protein n=1 Tax=Lysobacter cavernae TaxID=1685901 RepID=A0ABV7RPA4_9GAMM